MDEETENREPRFVDEELKQQFIAHVESLVALKNEYENFNWEVDEDRLNWLDTDLSNLDTIKNKLEYTYYVE